MYVDPAWIQPSRKVLIDKSVSTTFKGNSGWVSGLDLWAEFEWRASEEIQNNLADCSEIKVAEHKK